MIARTINNPQVSSPITDESPLQVKLSAVQDNPLVVTVTSVQHPTFPLASANKQYMVDFGP